MPPAQPQPFGSLEDIIVYNGRPHSRAYALAEFVAARVPTAWIERTLAEAPVIFAQPQSGPPVFFDFTPCHDELGRFAPCGSERAEQGEKIRAEKKEKKEKEKTERAERRTKERAERTQKKETEKQLKQAAKEVRSIAKEKTFPPPSGAPVLSGGPTANQSRVGVAGDAVPPPPAHIPRLPNLTADERYAEDRFATAYERDPDGVAGKFLKEQVVGPYERAKADGKKVVPTFETDAAKMLSGDYNPQGVSKQESLDAKGRYNAATHQTANAIAKRAFANFLPEVAKLPEDQRRAVKTDGGCGSGKGYAVENAMGDLSSKIGAIYDSAGEQNSTENEWFLGECKKNGVKATFVFVHADPSSTWEDPKGGVIERAKGKGRMVDAQLFTDSYVEGAKNFKAFMDKHKDDPDCEFVCIDNSVRGKNPDGTPILPKKLDGFPEAALKFDPEKLYARSANYVASVTGLSPAIRRGASIGRRIWGPPSDDAVAPKKAPKKAAKEPAPKAKAGGKSGGKSGGKPAGKSGGSESPKGSKHEPAVDQWGATAEDRRQLARHGIAWGD
jgi:hypothetical protein